MEYLSELRSVWAETVLTDTYHPKASFLSRHPLRTAHPLTEILSSLLLKREHKIVPPLQREISPLPLGELCQLALLQAMHGEDGNSLANQLLPLLSFSSLWCPESRGSEEETVSSIDLLLRAFGRAPKVEIKDPYFRAIAKFLPQFTEIGSAPFPLCEVILHQGISSAFIRKGGSSPLASLCIGSDLIVPALGPQRYPLNDPSLLGVNRLFDQSPWSQVSSLPAVWMERSQFDFRFIGMTMETKLAFVFYVRGRKAQIGQEVYASKSLRKFQGRAQKVVFDTFSIENKVPYKMELIPLAGTQAFWNSDFLLAFEIPPHDPRVCFDISSSGG